MIDIVSKIPYDVFHYVPCGSHTEPLDIRHDEFDWFYFPVYTIRICFDDGDTDTIFLRAIFLQSFIAQCLPIDSVDSITILDYENYETLNPNFIFSLQAVHRVK